MPRRRLVFDVPEGREVAYWKIPKEQILGYVWAPFYANWAYHLPTYNVPQADRARVDFLLKTSAWTTNILNLLYTAPWLYLRKFKTFFTIFGGGVLWVELESMFSNWDSEGKAVTFGGSGYTNYAVGFMLGWGYRHFGWWKKLSGFKFVGIIIAMLATANLAFSSLRSWAKSGFKAFVSEDVMKATNQFKLVPHRMDNVAHVGGLVLGLIAAYFVA